MRYCLLACLFWGAIAQAQLLAAKSALLTRVRAPLKFTETPKADVSWPGGATVNFDFGSSDMDVKVYNFDGNFSLEVILDVHKVFQAILPTDSFGNVTKEARALAKSPFIKFQSSHFGSHLVTVNCTHDSCRGVWPRFPYTPKKTIKMKAETNIRGLAGRVWTAVLNQNIPQRGVVDLNAPFYPKTTLDNPHRKEQPASKILVTRLYKGKEVLQYPWPEDPHAPLDFVDEWRFDKNAGPGGIGYHKVAKHTVFEVWEGPALFELAVGKDSLEAFELYAGDRIYIAPGTILSVSAGRQGTADVVLRHMEFSDL